MAPHHKRGSRSGSNPDLERAYRRARYRVQQPDAEFEMVVDQRCEAARDVLARLAAAGAAYLTACNPGSRLHDDDANRRAQDALLAAVADAAYPWLPGEALDPDGNWPPEPSLLVIGISVADARALARRFEQNALVYVDAEGWPRLIWA